MPESRRLYLAALAAAAVITAALAGTATAVTPEHNARVTETFPVDDFCGFSGTGTNTAGSNFIALPDGSFVSTVSGRFTFTSDSGKTVGVQFANQNRGPAPIIDETNGTITFITTFNGLPERLFIPGQGTLSRDAGTVTFVDVFALNPDGSVGDFISQTFFDEHGPHPDLESNFELFCDLFTPYLQDP